MLQLTATAILAGIVSVLLGAGPSFAQDPVLWRGNGWTVALTSGDRPLGCHGFTDQDGTRLTIALYRNGEWRGLTGEHTGRPNLPPGPVQLVVDNQVVHSGNGEVFGGGGIRFGNLPSRAVVALSQGYALEILTPTANRRLSLAGSEDAMANIAQCVSRVFEIEHQRSNTPYRIKPDVGGGALNLRAGPSTSAGVIAAIPAGTPGVLPLGKCAPSSDVGSSFAWCQFEVAGVRGWLSMRGVVEIVPQGNRPIAVSPSAQPPAPVGIKPIPVDSFADAKARFEKSQDAFWDAYRAGKFDAQTRARFCAEQPTNSLGDSLIRAVLCGETADTVSGPPVAAPKALRSPYVAVRPVGAKHL